MRGNAGTGSYWKEGTFEDCPFFAGAGLEAWDVRGGRDFECMFWGCAGLRADLSGWRLGPHHQAIDLGCMLSNTEGAEVGSLEGWAEERAAGREEGEEGEGPGGGGVAGVDVYWMLEGNRGSIATPGWARRARDFSMIRGEGGDPWAACKLCQHNYYVTESTDHLAPRGVVEVEPCVVQCLVQELKSSI